MEEHEQFQCYFSAENKVEEDNVTSALLSEDIWKKFELVPPPFVSPVEKLKAGDRLDWGSQFLGQDNKQEVQFRLSAEETLESSNIIQDCMWSSLSATPQMGKVVSEGWSCQMQRKLSSTALFVPVDAAALKNLTPAAVFASHSPEGRPEAEPPCKKIQQENLLPQLVSTPRTPERKPGSVERRKFLERKRRSDMRSSLMALQHEIPGCPNKPIAGILTKATEYLHTLREINKQKIQEKMRLESRRWQLLRRIALLSVHSIKHLEKTPRDLSVFR